MDPKFLLDAVYLWGGALLLPRIALKAPFSRRYRAGLFNRFGLMAGLPETPDGRLWIHCASVGEASIPLKLFEILHTKFPNLDFVFSSCTDTGLDRLKGLYSEHQCFYLPFDFSFAVDNALERVKPSLLILVEQEIWPNMLLGCYKRNVPVAIINGRINDKSCRLVRALFRLFPSAAEAIKLCCARSDTDAKRFRYAGLDSDLIHTTGSLKYDSLKTSEDESEVQKLRNKFAVTKDEQILVGGSTHPGEEDALLNVWKKLRSKHTRLRLVLVPRHIERADIIAKMLNKADVKVVRQTETEEQGSVSEIHSDTVILVDTIGELPSWYALADVVFVGRSLTPPGGGQNMMEPAALGKPVILGPYTRNFEPEVAALARDNAVICVNNSSELEREISRILTDKNFAQSVGRAAKNVIELNRGAANLTFNLLRPLILEKNTKNGIISA